MANYGNIKGKKGVDNISAYIDGGWVVPKENVKKAKTLIGGMDPDFDEHATYTKTGKEAPNPNAKISNGELVLNDKHVNLLERNGADPRSLSPNSPYNNQYEPFFANNGGPGRSDFSQGIYNYIQNQNRPRYGQFKRQYRRYYKEDPSLTERGYTDMRNTSRPEMKEIQQNLSRKIYELDIHLKDKMNRQNQNILNSGNETIDEKIIMNNGGPPPWWLKPKEKPKNVNFYGHTNLSKNEGNLFGMAGLDSKKLSGNLYTVQPTAKESRKYWKGLVGGNLSIKKGDAKFGAGLQYDVTNKKATPNLSASYRFNYGGKVPSLKNQNNNLNDQAY